MIRRAAASLPLLALLAAAMAGCSRDTTSYPSLSPRPIEKLGFAEPEVTPAVAKPDPALDATLAETSAALDKIASGFSTDLAATEKAAAAARGKAVGSDAWLSAQTALAGLDDWRAQASALTTDLDTAAADRAARLDPPYPALTALHDKAQAEAEREGSAIARVQAALPTA